MVAPLVTERVAVPRPVTGSMATNDPVNGDAVGHDAVVVGVLNAAGPRAGTVGHKGTSGGVAIGGEIGADEPKAQVAASELMVIFVASCHVANDARPLIAGVAVLNEADGPAGRYGQLVRERPQGRDDQCHGTGVGGVHRIGAGKGQVGLHSAEALLESIRPLVMLPCPSEVKLPACITSLP